MKPEPPPRPRGAGSAGAYRNARHRRARPRPARPGRAAGPARRARPTPRTRRRTPSARTRSSGSSTSSQGRVTIPDGKAATLEQPQGREYRGFREEVLPWLGGIAILGMVVLLAAFYFTKGRIRLEQGEESGRKILRFNAFERFTHWLTAISLHRARHLRPQLHLRQAAPDAAHRPGRLRRLVAMGEVRPQLPVLAVHARPPLHAGGLDQGQRPRPHRHSLAQGGRRLPRRHAPAGAALQRRPEARVLVRDRRRPLCSRLPAS